MFYNVEIIPLMDSLMKGQMIISKAGDNGNCMRFNVIKMLFCVITWKYCHISKKYQTVYIHIKGSPSAQSPYYIGYQNNLQSKLCTTECNFIHNYSLEKGDADML